MRTVFILSELLLFLPYSSCIRARVCTCFLNLGIAVAQEHAGKVLYNTTVTKIAKQTALPDDNGNHKFYVHATTNNDGNGDRNERHTFESQM